MKRLILSLTLGLLVVGCANLQTNFQNNAGKFLTSVALTVDAAMKGWAIYDVSGHSNPAEEAQVKAIYQQYQTYFAVATNSYTLALAANNFAIFIAPSNNLQAVQNQIVTLTTKGTK